MIKILAPATAGIDIIKAGVFAEPSTQAGPHGNMVAFNLRRNFNLADPRASDPAFSFLGHVGVTFDPGDPVSDFTFGWVQFMKQVAWNFVYAGRDDSEGQVEITPLSLIGTNFLIDRDPGAGARFSPLAQEPRRNFTYDSVLQQAVAKFADHPMTLIQEKVFNNVTRVENFLFSAVDIRKLVSIFVVRDNLGRITPLAHVNSDLVYNGTFKWRDRRVLPVSNLSSFTSGPVFKGGPSGEVAGLMARLSPSMLPAYNPTADSAYRTAFVAGSSNRREIDHYEAQVPPLFFLEGRASLDIP